MYVWCLQHKLWHGWKRCGCACVNFMKNEKLLRVDTFQYFWEMFLVSDTRSLNYKSVICLEMLRICWRKEDSRYLDGWIVSITQFWSIFGWTLFCSVLSYSLTETLLNGGWQLARVANRKDADEIYDTLPTSWFIYRRFLNILCIFSSFDLQFKGHDTLNAQRTTLGFEERCHSCICIPSRRSYCSSTLQIRRFCEVQA